MRTILAPVAAALVACVSLSAQADHWESSPSGLESVEGNMSLDLIGREGLLRFQQIDTTSGPRANRNRVGFRRDGLILDSTQYRSRNVELEVIFSEADLGSSSMNFAGNYTGNTSTVVSRKTISFGDWTFAPVVPPVTTGQAPEFITIGLDTNWSYPGSTGGTDFLIEFRVYSNDQAGRGYPGDADTAAPLFLINGGEGSGTGCIATGRASPSTVSLEMLNWGSKLSMNYGVSNNVAGAPAFGNLAGGPAAFPLPGLCAQLLVNPVGMLTLGLGITDGFGDVTATFDPLPYNPALIGAELYAQGMVLDVGQPGSFKLAVTDQRKTAIPSDPPTTSGAKHFWALDPSATMATGSGDGGYVFFSNHP
ncbi:MAG: hypothetical protein AAF628_04730 [Planctomycetota bacterium]